MCVYVCACEGAGGLGGLPGGCGVYRMYEGVIARWVMCMPGEWVVRGWGGAGVWW